MDVDFIPIALFISITAIFLGYFYFKNRTRESLNETVKVALNKGEKVSADFFLALQAEKRDSFGDFRKGVLWISFGLALGIFFGVFETDDPAWVIGLFPTFLGLGYLIVWKMHPKDTE